MRIGLNLLYLIPDIVGGSETYARGLIDGFAKVGRHHEFDVFVNREGADWSLPEQANFRRIVCPLSGTRRTGRYVFEQVRLPSILKARKLDILHSLGNVAPLAPGCRSVVTIHDMHFLAYGDRKPIGRRAILRALVPASAARADHVLTVSEFSRQEVCRHLGVPPCRVTVTHEAPETRWTDEGARNVSKAREGGHAVAFGSLSPHKNILRLVHAYKLARCRGLRQRLVIVGHLPAALSETLPDGLELSGYLDNKQLVEKVAGADFLIFPSLYEGFGLPVLEAMAAGVPVLCSNRASLPEVAGEAALFFDPESIEAMANGMRAMGSDPVLRSRLRERGFENAKRFSWQRTAMETLAVYESVMRRSTGGR